MLNRDPHKRPSINKIVRYPLIESRAKILLGDTNFEKEFSHSGIHGDVFEDFAKKEKLHE